MLPNQGVFIFSSALPGANFKEATMATQEQMTPSEQYWTYYEKKAAVPTELSYFSLALTELTDILSLDFFQNNPAITRSLVSDATASAEWMENTMQDQAFSSLENAAAAWTLLDNFGPVNLSQEDVEEVILPVTDELARRQVVAVAETKSDAKETRSTALKIIRAFSQAYTYLLGRQIELEEKKQRAAAAYKQMQEQAQKEGSNLVTTTDKFVDATRKKTEDSPKELDFITNTISKINVLLENLGAIVNRTYNVSSLSDTATVATI